MKRKWKLVAKLELFCCCFTYTGFRTKSLLIKFLASGEITSNASSSKSNAPLVTLDIVCKSLSPMKGLRPDKLRTTVVSVHHKIKIVKEKKKTYRT